MAKRKSHLIKSKKVVKQIIPKRVFDKLAGDGKQFSRNQKERIGRDLVKKMNERSNEGLDINEEKFAPYGSASKRKTEAGRLEALRKKEKILGKKINPNNVDMQISKKLLKSINVKVTEDGDLEILHKGKKNNLKALGHLGNRSQRPKGVPQREYFGATEEEVEETSNNFTPRDIDGEG